MILYARYLELYGEYRNTEGKGRQLGFERVWRHAYRMRDRMMLSTVALCDRDRFRDRSVQVPDDVSSWQSSEPFDAAEIAAMLSAGIATNQPTVLDFEAKKYSDDLIPATQLDLLHVSPGGYDNRGRGRQQIYTWFPENRRQIALDVTGGLIEHYRDRGNVKVALHSRARSHARRRGPQRHRTSGRRAASDCSHEPLRRAASIGVDGWERHDASRFARGLAVDDSIDA